MSYCEIPEFFSSRWVVARKPHRCCECGGDIPKGEFHGYFSGKWDGDLNSYRQHIECEDACRWLRDVKRFDGGECLYFGELFEVDHDYAGDRSDKMFRRIMAHIRFRKKKGRRPGFLPPYSIDYSKLPGLVEARAKRSAGMYD